MAQSMPPLCPTKQIPEYLFIIAFVLPSLLNRLLERQRFLKIKYFNTDVQYTHHYKMHGGPERLYFQ